MKTLRSRRHRQLCLAIAQARERAGLSQRVLADKIKRPHSYIGKIESGERRLDVVEFVELAEALNVDPCELILAITR